MVLAVDVGRSSVKITGQFGNISFPFLFTTKKIESIDYVMSDASNLQWAEYRGENLIVGDTARLVGDVVYQTTEGNLFHEWAMKITCFAIAWYLKNNNINDEEIDLAINLTYTNMYMKQDYIDFFKTNTHSFTFLDKQIVTFKIRKVAVLYQGHAGLFDVALNENLNVKSDFYKTDGVVLDWGRLTLNFIFVSEMIPKIGETKDFGVFKLYQLLIEELKKNYGVVKDFHEIENLIKNKKKITTLDNIVIDVFEILHSLMEKIWVDFDLLFRQFIVSKTPDYIVLLGGGSHFVSSFFKKKYKNVSILEEPQWANVRGMYKFMQKVVSIQKG